MREIDLDREKRRLLRMVAGREMAPNEYPIGTEFTGAELARLLGLELRGFVRKAHGHHVLSGMGETVVLGADTRSF